ncbi:MAG TPA: small ribosomal subunit biogenesis GTPase RsgA [Thermosynechococcus sp. M3746_W2019_013]|uniref:small ribosomal subunit biogenesis GTPase RsgA n=1 Tax=Thermosynechococcus sp. M3746_W2019_013 TaxID=2747806 RepID=UPI0019F06EE3|nr:small ribosomal subunit biogenesis GTPase RsgA [Thermosynechococcus sp. M3746_W2019_013]HIK24120.1 small ribosomal subunit biogenesis GTPase RsgA [Thermosynechococcus sp. M3746_W2019_013]
MSELVGLVRAVQANYYRVRLREPTNGVEELLCVRRARLKKMGQQICVGDWVVVSHPDWPGQRGAIAEILPRRNQLPRPAIANVDQILLLFALVDPPADVHQITRFLLTAEGLNVEIQVVFTKADLVSPQAQQQWRDRLQQWGYRCHVLSLTQGTAWQALRPHLANQITVVCGPSGVGKSSLIRHLTPREDIRVSVVSDHWHRGRHTTRHVELFPLPAGGWIADTPGFNQPELPPDPQQLAAAFPEIRQRLSKNQCLFDNCRHDQEPGCCVRGNWERYPLYIAYLHQLETIASSEPSLGKVPPVKAKSDRQGQQRLEPLLDPKKYRRRSRRQQHQHLNPMAEEVLDSEW